MSTFTAAITCTRFSHPPTLPPSHTHTSTHILTHAHTHSNTYTPTETDIHTQSSYKHKHLFDNVAEISQIHCSHCLYRILYA